jgi:hypothetical protein
MELINIILQAITVFSNPSWKDIKEKWTVRELKEF